MDYLPHAVTEADVKELVACQDLRDAFGADNDADFEHVLRDLWIAKFPHYITDGPGYAGEVFVILSGVLNTILVIRKNGALKMCEQEH
jgi:hypothetical protein